MLVRAHASLLAVLLVSLVAGCVGGASTANSATPSPSAPTDAAPPTAGSDEGALHGTVVDDESNPIVAADVTLLPIKRTTRTDAAGSFTLNELAPGSYSLIVQALGFESSGKKVDIAAGEVVKANIVLRAIVLDSQPFYVPILQTAFINADQTWLTFVYHDLLHQNHSAVCGTCTFIVPYTTKGAIQLMTENGWTQTTVPAYNDGVHLSIFIDGGFQNHEFCWHEQESWDNTTLPKAKTIEITVQSSFAGVSVQHRVDMWNTFAYGSTLPEGYSAFPPTTEKPQAQTVCNFK